MGYDRRENEQRLNAFVEAYASGLEERAEGDESAGLGFVAWWRRQRADAVRAISIPNLPFLRR